MPLPLKVVYWGSCVFSALGWVLAVAVGRGGGGIPALLLVAVLLFPLAVTFALGFSEQQRWTRPLIVLTLVGAAALAWLATSAYWTLASFALPVGASFYLYGSRDCRAYYGALRELASVRLSAADFVDPSFVPLYAAAAGGAVGGCLGYWGAVRHLGYSSGLGANDAAGLVLAVVLAAVLLGIAGLWCSEALVSRRQWVD